MPMKRTINLRIEQDPYPHLRDDEGCVLAHDYQSVGKLAFIVHACSLHDELVGALQQLLSRAEQLGAEDEQGPETIGPCPSCQRARAVIARAEVK